MRVDPPKSRIQHTPLSGGARLVIPAVREGCGTVFILFWLCGWALGELAMLLSLLKEFHWKLLLFTALWSLGGLMALSRVLWTLTGREEITITPAGLEHVRYVAGFPKRRRYPAERLANLRIRHTVVEMFTMEGVSESVVEGKDSIAFDDGEKEVQIAGPLNAVEATELLRILEAGLAGSPASQGEVFATAAQISEEGLGAVPPASPMSDAPIGGVEAPPQVIKGPLVLPAKLNLQGVLHALIGSFWTSIGFRLLYGVTSWYDDPEVFFPLVVLVVVLGGFLLYGGLGELVEFAWQLLGREEIEIRPGLLVHRRPLGFWKRAREYDLTRVRNLRITLPAQDLLSWLGKPGPPGCIAFDYGAESCWIAPGLTARRAEEVYEWIRGS